MTLTKDRYNAKQTNKQIDVTFIVPVYNTADYLVECLNSILSQDFEKEIIIIDDGSTDNSLEIILEYQNRYKEISLIRHHNEGLSRSRNKAIKIARGNYISFIDSDDYLVGNISSVLALGKNHHSELIRFGAVWRYEFPNEVKHIQIPFLFSNTKMEPQTASLLTGYNALLEVHRNGYWIPGLWCTLIQKDYLETYNLFFEEDVLAEDQLFYIQLLTSSELCKIIEIPSLHYIYRQRHGGAITSRTDEKYVIDHFKMIKSILEYIQNIPSALHPSIFFIIERLLETAFYIVRDWSVIQQNEFSYIFRRDWKNMLANDHSDYWRAFLSILDSR